MRRLPRRQERKDNLVAFKRPKKRSGNRRLNRVLSYAVASILLIAGAGYVANQELNFPTLLVSLDRAAFPICGAGRRITCTVDGDTVWLRGEKIRLEGIDAPEVSKPQCGSEAQLAGKATRRLSVILSTNEWKLVRNGQDRFGRTLAKFWIGNTTAGGMLIAEGLARQWTGRKEQWC